MNYFSFYKGGKALYCLFFTGILSAFSSSFATVSVRNSFKSVQQHQVKGIVTDGSAPLPGVNIAVKGNSQLIAVSDYTGQFQINASASDTLIVSFIGFKSQKVPVQSRTRIDIILEYDATALQEVHINAGYYSVKESERTGNIARITSKDIENQPVTNVLAAMQGRMAGVNITQTTGTPGGGFDIKIRGQNSLRFGANNPLYIIDGVPYSADPIGSGSGSAFLPSQPSPLNSISPEQIESIEVLKDADATSIYGSRGANGVVLITTKSGKAGKTAVTLKASTGIGTVTRFMDLMNTEQYLKMRRDAYKNDNINSFPPYAYDVNGTWDPNRYTDWQKELLGGAAQISDIQASITGGSQQTQFVLSGNFNKQTSVLSDNFRYKKGSFHLNVNHESENKKFKAAIVAGYTLQDNNQPQFDMMREAVQIAPNAPALLNADGTLNWADNTFDNPLRNLEAKYDALTNDFLSSINLSYAVTSDLKLQSNFGYTVLNNTENTTIPSTKFNPAYGIGPESSALVAGQTNRNSYIFEPQLNWNKSFGVNKISFLAGATFQSQSFRQLVQYAYGFASNSLISNLGSAGNVLTYVSDERQYKYQAFFARINYNYKEKYILNLTARRDGSSRFGPGEQFGTFGAAGLAWLFSKENLFANSKLLSYGKLRASYGTTGSDQIGDYQYLDTYRTGSSTYGGVSILQPSRLFNPKFSWEVNRKFETAVEAGFFQDRLFLTASYYDNRSSNQLTGISLPRTTGFSSIQANMDATVQNSGMELTARIVNFQNEHWSWITNFNISFAKNKLLNFSNLETSTYANTLVIGKSLNIQKMYHYTGLNPLTGIYTFEDVNADGLLTAIEDKKAIVDLTPKYYGGFQNTLKYKNWQLDFFFQFVQQNNYNASSFFALPGTQSNQLAAAADSWQNTGDSASYQVYTSGDNSQAVSAHSRYFESDGAISDASYVRLKNLSLSYQIPVRDFKCMIFFEGQNLLTFTKYEGADPEFIAFGFLPPLKIFSAGLKFNF